MKRLVWAFVVAMIMSVALYATTMVFSASATSSAPYVLDFTNSVNGHVSAEIRWAPRKNTNYIMQLFRYTDPANPYNSEDPNFQCLMSTYNLVPPGDFVCDFPAGAAGLYRLYFRPYNGGAVSFTGQVVTN